nr:MAG TPA: hypothetical protein [Caudoviricetes sp.]
MANNIWSNYTEKTATPVDTDEVMARDSTDGKNKRLLFGTFWKWVAKKLNDATISELETENKTVIGALNYLNGNVPQYKNCDYREYSDIISALNKNKNLFKYEHSYILTANTIGGFPHLVLFGTDENGSGSGLSVEYGIENGSIITFDVNPDGFTKRRTLQ